MEKKIYNVTLEKADYEKFRAFLRKSGMQYEPSGYGERVYISMNLSDTEAEKAEAFLQML